MKVLRWVMRLATFPLAILATLMLAQGPAFASTLAPDISDYEDGFIENVALYDCDARSWPPDLDEVEYSSFVDDDSPHGNVPLYGAVWRPEDPGSYPILIMVHGGGWRSGCRLNISQIASDAAENEGYIVFSIDYRLACVEGTVSEGQIDVLCDHYSNNPAVDAKDAVAYARNNGHDWDDLDNDDVLWDGTNVAMLGFSSGGNLAYMAGITGSTANDTLPDAVAGWSGPTEMVGLLSSGVACNSAADDKKAACKAAREQYVNCDIFPPGSAQQACLDAADYASPVFRLDDSPNTDVAPTFIANGTYELTADDEAQDLFDELDGRVGSGERDLCIADTDENEEHATGLKDLDCEDLAGGTVWERTFDFFLANL